MYGWLQVYLSVSLFSGGQQTRKGQQQQLRRRKKKLDKRNELGGVFLFKTLLVYISKEAHTHGQKEVSAQCLPAAKKQLEKSGYSPRRPIGYKQKHKKKKVESLFSCSPPAVWFILKGFFPIITINPSPPVEIYTNLYLFPFPPSTITGGLKGNNE